MQSTVQLFDNEDVKELDLITNESLDIPDFKNDTHISRNIPILSSSSKYVRRFCSAFGIEKHRITHCTIFYF